MSSSSNNNNNHNPSAWDHTNDLGGAQYDAATATATDRDTSVFMRQPVTVLQGRAPPGCEDKVLAWSQFQYTTEERNLKEEKKEDLHGGQLHRQNKAAQILTGQRPPSHVRGSGTRGGRGGRGGGRGGGRAGNAHEDDGKMDPLCAGRKPEGRAVPPLAKGIPEELDRSMFWGDRIG